MDDLVDAVYDAVGNNNAYGVAHRGGNLFEVGVNTRSALVRVLDCGLTVAGHVCPIEPLGPRTVTVVCKMVPLHMRNENLIRALSRFGKVLKLEDITFEDRKGRGTLRTGNKKVIMEMGEKSPLPNFLRVLEALVQCDYPGVKRVCRRCKQEGHVRAACKVPFCERCSSFGHTTDECGSRCRRCRTRHSQGPCPAPTSYAGAARLDVSTDFPALSPAVNLADAPPHSEALRAPTTVPETKPPAVRPSMDHDSVPVDLPPSSPSVARHEGDPLSIPVYVPQNATDVSSEVLWSDDSMLTSSSTSLEQNLPVADHSISDSEATIVCDMSDASSSPEDPAGDVGDSVQLTGPTPPQKKRKKKQSSLHSGSSGSRSLSSQVSLH